MPLNPSPATPQTVAVVHEDFSVETTREEVGAVRVRIEADAFEARVELEHRRDEWAVERIDVERPVDAALPPWMDGDTLVVPVYRQEAVVTQRLVLAQELRLVRSTVRTPETRAVTLRRERAVVERRQADGSWQAIDVPPAALPDDARPAGNTTLDPHPEGAFK